MAKLILKYEDRILRDIPLGSYPTSIGRLPDNSLVIDNPAVSGHHARLVTEGDRHILEDLQSTNGTFVNEQRITRHTLRDGDIVLVGKHKLVYDRTGDKNLTDSPTQPLSAPAQPISQLQGTIMLDTKAHRELLARIPREGQAAASKPAILSVVSGKTDRSEYALEAQTSMIGKSKTAQIRLKGWFKPEVAAAITRNANNYVINPLGGKIRVNDQLLAANQELKDGDALHVSGVNFKFTLR